MLTGIATFAINLASAGRVTPKMLSRSDAAPRWTDRAEVSMIASMSPAFRATRKSGFPTC